MDQLIPPPEVNPEVNRMAQALLPEYLRPNNEPIEWPTQPGKMKPVDPMNPAPWLTADLVGGAAGLGVKSAAGLGMKSLPAVFVGPNAIGSDLKAWEFARALMQGAKRQTGQGSVVPGVNDQVVHKLYERTGLHPGLEGGFRREISDAPMQIKQLGHGLMKDNVEHPELFHAYPELGELPVTLRYGPKQTGGFGQSYGGIEAAGPTDFQRRIVLAHELQHAVQRMENLPPGGNPKELLRAFHPNPELMTDEAYHNGLNRANELYMSLGGEVEARNAHTRLGFNQYRFPPWQTEDTARSQQLVPGHWLHAQPPQVSKQFLRQTKDVVPEDYSMYARYK